MGIGIVFAGSPPQPLKASYVEGISPSALITSLQVQPPLSQTWQLVGFAVSCVLQAQATGAMAAKLGKVLAFLLPAAGYTSSGEEQFAPLPTDSSLGVELWDGSQDPFPPIAASASGYVAGGQSMPLQAQLQLAFPVSVSAGATIGIGLWMTPMLVTAMLGLGVLQLNIAAAQYVVIFDDGVNPTTNVTTP